MANSVQRVALYARVSTSNGTQDPEMQLRELRGRITGMDFGPETSCL